MNERNEYLLLARGEEWANHLSSEELREVMDRVKGWFGLLAESGRLKAAQPLGREGAVVSGKGGRLVADGPFAETKELIGGYCLVEANSLEEAIAIAQCCPTLEFGAQIEVRPVAAECSATARARQTSHEAEVAAAA